VRCGKIARGLKIFDQFPRIKAGVGAGAGAGVGVSADDTAGAKAEL
tara:strand:+ start:4139 stop:4276 length:138 start_codon:yes stop_codon:yes gene_type:complete